MTYGASPDPIASVHQVLALLEFPELDDYERSVLSWHRESLQTVRANPSPSAWSAWYRGLLDAIAQLGARWQSAKPEPSLPPRLDASPHVLSMARIKEASGAFLQHWNVRLQEQAHGIKSRLTAEVAKVAVGENHSTTHIVFEVHQRDIELFRSYVERTLAGWSADVEAKLTASWLAHLQTVLAAEPVPRAPSSPPPWGAVRLASSGLPAPHLDPHVARRSTMFQAVMRSFQSVRGVFTIISTAVTSGAVFIVTAEKSSPIKETLAALFAIGTLLLGGSFGLWLGVNQQRDDLAQTRLEQAHRLHGVLQSWTGTVTEAQKSRLQALLAASAGEMRSRLSEWVDASWGLRQPARELLSPGPSRDCSQLLFALNSARNTIAARLSQLQYEAAEPPRSLSKAGG